MVVGSPIVLNLVPGGVMKMVHVNQADKNIDIQFQIMNGNQPYNIPEGWTGTIRGTKGDAFGYSAAVTVTAGSNVVTVHLKEQLTAVAGVGNIFELVFASTSAKVSTENFILAVERSALNDETVISESDLVYANQVLNQLQSVAAVNQQVQQNKSNIAAETAARQTADNTLQSNINAEATARQAADNTLQGNINAEASTRATADASLQSQIDQLVAPSGEAPSAAEVLNARIGADGVTYPTLGDAIRTNDAELKSHLEAIDSELTAEITQSTQYIAFVFDVGKRYTLYNGTNNSMNAHTMTAPSASGTEIEAIGTNIQSGATVVFEPTTNASYARFYCNGRGTVTVKNISYGVPKLEIDVSELKADAESYVQKDGFQQVNERNTTFFTQNANLFNKDTVVENYDLKQNGSGLYAATGYMATEEYIDVSNLNSIKALALVNGAVAAASIRYVLYDANKTALNQRTITNAVIDTSEASYLRFGGSLGQKDILMVVPGDVEVTEYIPYGFKFNYAEEKEVTLVEINPTDDIIQKLLDNKGKDIHFNAGDYDIIAQYEAHFGSDYFTNYTDYTSGGDNLGRGLPVYRDTRVTFSQGAVFSANYTGSNAAVRTNFSAFWLESGVTVDGLRMSANGIRNIIHDDFDNTYNGVTVIKNCHLTGDTNIIGGGLGLHETVIIENCYIERTNGSATYDFSYHNNGNAGAQSLLIVKGNYLGRGFSVRWYGPSTLLTDVMVNNNSMAYEVDIHAENASATIENINLKSWNNEIRTV